MYLFLKNDIMKSCATDNPRSSSYYWKNTRKNFFGVIFESFRYKVSLRMNANMVNKLVLNDFTFRNEDYKNILSVCSV